MIINFKSWLHSWILPYFLVFSSFCLLYQPADIFFWQTLFFLAFAYVLLVLTSLGHSLLEAGLNLTSPLGHLPAAPVLLLRPINDDDLGDSHRIRLGVKSHSHEAHLIRWALWSLSLPSNESTWVPYPRSLVHSAACKTSQAHRARQRHQRALHSAPAWPGEGPTGWPSQSYCREKAWHHLPTLPCTQSTPCCGWHLHS